MKNSIGRMRNTSRIAAGSIVCLAALHVPQALAHDAAQRIRLLEQKLQAIQTELEKVKTESSQATQKVNSIEQTTNQTVQKVNTIQQNNTAMESRIAPIEKQVEADHHMLFFRGGYTHMMNHRSGVTIENRVLPIGSQDHANKDGWYVGAGLDWNLTNNVWGAMPKTSIFAELMFEYKQFGSQVKGNGAVGNAPSMLAGGTLNPINVTISQFTLTASPKIKFFEGSKLRPWIIPAGLAIHVMSPPSESITYIAPGVQFGAGVDYNVWKNFYVGIDARYHLTAGKTDHVNLSGMTAGGYLGIGF